MSPTMTEGSISEWKVKEGDKFSAGDVLLSIETDKASIDVEAQDDGVMGKILVNGGESGVQVGKLIALLAEEGDDLSSIEVPEESSAPSAPKEEGEQQASKPANAPEQKHESSAPATSSSAPTTAHALPHPKSDKPLLPSVMRMLVLNGIKDANEIKGTGFKGTLTKGDVLAHLGKIKSPLGTDQAVAAPSATKKAAEPAKPAPPLDGPALRRLIATGLGVPTKTTVVHDVPHETLTFEQVLNDYLPPSQRLRPSPAASANKPASEFGQFFS